ncbi:MADF domain-containing protein, partial [Aphis craccivora]
SKKYKLVFLQILENFTIKELKNKKWKHVHDAYLKYMSVEKSIRNGSEATQKPYAYAQIMSFLNTTTKKKRASGYRSAVH